MLTKRGGLIQSVEQSEDWFTGMVAKFYLYFGYFVIRLPKYFLVERHKLHREFGLKGALQF